MRAVLKFLPRPGLRLLLLAAAGWSSCLAAGADDAMLAQWLQRVHEAARTRTYTGTVVVSSAEGAMSSARVWHACDAGQQVERVDSLTGTPRTTFRRNDQVMTFLPQTHVAVSERRESLGLFPQRLGAQDAPIDTYYRASAQGHERVAGFEADVVQLAPRDALRYGYRVWTERQSGLVVKMQTLDTQGHVLEQVVFSELHFDGTLSADKLGHMMDDTRGYHVVSPAQAHSEPEQEGWRLAHEVPGFRPAGCYHRAGDGNGASMQWVFSDGLATVSLFVEPYDVHRHSVTVLQSMGATHAYGQRLAGAAADWWLTAVGEVPAQTLQLFARELERLH
jgi:sigma-E factor negative regulatory protein RseB